MSAERYKVLPVIALKMWKLSAIESLRHRVVCGDSRPRLSAEQSSAFLESSRNLESVGLGSLTNSCPISDWESWMGNLGELRESFNCRKLSVDR